MSVDNSASRGQTAIDGPAPSSSVLAVGGAERVARVAGGTAIARVALPLGLAAIQVGAALLLVFVALAAPPKQEGFRGLVNDTISSGARRRLELYRDALGWVPGARGGLDLSPTAYVWGLRAALVVLALVQLGALLACLRQRTARAGEAASLGPWSVGPVATSLVLLAYPPLSSDIFYYAISGHAALHGANPYLVPPKAFPDDPFLPFNDWTGITSPYGPLWTVLSRFLVGLTNDDPIRTVVAFKVVAAVSGLGMAGVAYALALRLTRDSRRALGAFILVAWHPAVLIESAGTAHNDAAMMLGAVGGLLLLSRPGGGLRSGLLLLAASALVKYVTLPLLACAALWRLRPGGRSGVVRTALGQWVLDGAAIALLAAAVFGPFWAGTRTIRSLIHEPARLYVNPLWVLPRLAIEERWGREAAVAFRDLTREGGQWAVAALVLGAFVWLLARTWRASRPDGMPSCVLDASVLRWQVRAWAVMAAALAFVPVNAHAWYAVWAAAPIALAWASATPPETPTAVGTGRRRWLRRPPIPWWLILYLAWTTVSFVVYHTRATS